MIVQGSKELLGKQRGFALKLSFTRVWEDRRTFPNKEWKSLSFSKTAISIKSARPYRTAVCISDAVQRFPVTFSHHTSTQDSIRALPPLSSFRLFAVCSWEKPGTGKYFAAVLLCLDPQSEFGRPRAYAP